MNRVKVALAAAVILAQTAAGFDHTHAAWDVWLKKHVTVKGPVTTVDYKGVKASPESLTSYLKTVETVTADQYGKFSDPQKLAFLINAYNAFTVKLVVDNYPVKSIKEIGGLFTTPWKKKFFKLLGEEKMLDNIEHDMIRKNYNEPRIHFSVVCASKGCPALSNEAFRAEKLEAQFERAATMFLKDTDRNRYDAEKNELKISNIFKWYGDDFVKKAGSVQNFIAPRLGKTPAEQEKIKSAKIDHLDYDWTLNETASPKG